MLYWIERLRRSAVMHPTPVEFRRPLAASDKQPNVAQMAQRHACRVDKIVMLSLRELRCLVYDKIREGSVRGID